MVIDSICLYQDPLRWNGYWFSCAFISRPSVKQWSSIFHIKALFDWMVIDFVCLYKGPLRWNGHWFSLLSYRGPLQSNGNWSFISRPSPMNGHWFHLSISRPSSMEWSLIFLCFHIEALCKVMVIDHSYQGPLRWNGHWFCMFI